MPSRTVLGLAEVEIAPMINWWAVSGLLNRISGCGPTTDTCGKLDKWTELCADGVALYSGGDSVTQHPWVSGPGEILQHGLSLLERDNDKNRRLALLSIDNAVELTIKTFLGLPRRITGINL